MDDNETFIAKWKPIRDKTLLKWFIETQVRKDLLS